MKKMLNRIVAIGLPLFLAASLVSAQEVNLSRFRDQNPVILVFTRNLDDDRPFLVNLDLSTAWSGVTARGIQVVDVDPASHDVDRAAEQLQLGDREFAVILIARDGTVLSITDENGSVSELFEILDSHQPGE